MHVDHQPCDATRASDALLRLSTARLRCRRLRQIIDSPARTPAIAAAHRHPTGARRSPTTADRESEIRSVEIRSPCWTSVVGSRRQRRRHHPLNAAYRQLAPPCLVINRSRDTIRSSSRCRSSSSSSRRRAGEAEAQQPACWPGRLGRPQCSASL